jgi:hypothetical protein
MLIRQVLDSHTGLRVNPNTQLQMSTARDPMMPTME